MKKAITLLLLLAAPILSRAQATSLFISEIAEGSSNNKYIEIYNGTGSAVDLSAYSLSSCNNGCNTFGEFDFPDNVTFAPGTMLNDGDVYVIGHPSADATILADTNQSFVYLSNGDDVFALTLAGATASNYTIIDIVGDLQGDPGTGWPVAGTGNTKDRTLVRKSSVCQGNATELGSFGTDAASSEWIVYPQDTWTYLDAHTANCSGCNTSATISPVVCDTYTSPSGNYTWTTSGSYKDTIPNAAACDSVITINLTVNPTYNETATASICTGGSYTFGTQTLTTAGAYTETFTSVNGCDSVVNLTLSVVSSYNENATASICDGETYVLGTQNLTTSGSYTETLTSSQGCDSVVNLTLTVLPTFATNITETACDSYTAPDGMVYTTSGNYTAVLTAENGCDSTISIALTVNNSSTSSLTETACGSYTLNSTTYNVSGTFTQVIPNAVGCDSTITLNLTITPMPGAPTVTGGGQYCDGDAVVDLAATGMAFDSLIITGVFDGPLPGGKPKAVEFYAIHDISDLSTYGFGSANNGGGTDGEEYTFPAVALTAGDYFTVSGDTVDFNAFFGVDPNGTHASAPNVNGDDAIELFHNGAVIDVFGDINVDGSGQDWEYLDGWVYRANGSLPNGGTFNVAEWTYSGVDAMEGETTNASATTPFPIGTFTTTVPTSTITWYDGATVLGTGTTYTPSSASGTTTYTVTETLTGASTCESAITSVDVTFNALPTVSGSASTTELCAGEDLTLTGSGATSYTWDNNVTDGVAFPATTTMTYTVTGTDANGCSNTATVDVTVNPLPTVTFGALSDLCNYNDPITLTEGTPAGGTYSGTGVTGTTFNPTTAGNGTHTLTYSYTDGNSCTNTATSDIVVDGCLAIENLENAAITVYPNPASSSVTVASDAPIAKIQIVTVSGLVVETLTTNTFSVEHLSEGMYVLHIQTENGIATRRFIKK